MGAGTAAAFCVGKENIGDASCVHLANVHSTSTLDAVAGIKVDCLAVAVVLARDGAHLGVHFSVDVDELYGDQVDDALLQGNAGWFHARKGPCWLVWRELLVRRQWPTNQWLCH